MPIIDPRLPASPRKPALGWCRWRAANLKISATPLKCGRVAHWLSHVRSHAVEAGDPSLAKAAQATVQRILAEQPLHPERIKYYLERLRSIRREDQDGSHGVPGRRATERRTRRDRYAPGGH